MTTSNKWWTKTWNPITGCTPISAGCENCWAAAMMKRFGGIWGYDFTPRFHPDRLGKPAEWKKPKRIFVCSMGDLFHKETFDGCMHSAIFETMGDNPHHTYMLLTKRPVKMREALAEWKNLIERIPNLWLGVTVEDSDNLWRIDELLKLRPYASKLFVSVEPMLGAVDLSPYLPAEWYCHHCIRYFSEEGNAGQECCDCGCEIDDDPHRTACQDCGCQDWNQKCPACGESQLNGFSSFARTEVIPISDLPPTIDLIICGPENGPGKREFREEWAIDLRDQCKAAGVPFFHKGGSLAGETFNEFPEV